MTAPALLIWLLIGLIAGWLAGELTRGAGFALAGTIVVRIIGAGFGGLLAGALGLARSNTGNILWNVILAIIGAILLIAILSVVHRAAWPETIRSGSVSSSSEKGTSVELVSFSFRNLPPSCLRLRRVPSVPSPVLHPALATLAPQHGTFWRLSRFYWQFLHGKIGADHCTSGWHEADEGG